MPFSLKLRPGATFVRDNEVSSLHTNADFAFRSTVGWIESGPNAGGPDLETKGYSLAAICDYLVSNGPALGMNSKQIRDRVSRLRAHIATGNWYLFFVLVPLQQPSHDMVLIFGFNREHPENKQFADLHPPCEILCDMLMAWLL